MEVATGLLTFVLLLLGSAAGLLCQKLLRDRHRSHETVDALRLIVTIQVTFAALVLGLLVTSVKADFDHHDDLYRDYGIALIRLDRRLASFGPAAAPVRARLREYTAAVIADEWPREPLPSGTYPHVFTPLFPGSDETGQITDLLRQVDAGVQSLDPVTLYQQHLFPTMQSSVARVESIRWSLVEGATSEVSGVFLYLLVSWLVITFLMFGLIVPQNGLVYLAFFLSALSMASTIYLILDLNSGFGGFISLSSAPLRSALYHMDHGL